MQFNPTKAAVNAYRTAISTHLSRITEIPDADKSSMQDVLWRSVMLGGDLATLSLELQRQCGVTYNTAAAVALDLHGMAKAIMDAARALELGITEATWLYTPACKTPRPSHQALDQTRFALTAGVQLDDMKLWPGSERGCRCVSRSVIPGLTDESGD